MCLKIMASYYNMFLTKFKINHGQKQITPVTEKTTLKNWLKLMADIDIGFLTHHTRSIRRISTYLLYSTGTTVVNLWTSPPPPQKKIRATDTANLTMKVTYTSSKKEKER